MKAYCITTFYLSRIVCCLAELFAGDPETDPADSILWRAYLFLIRESQTANERAGWDFFRPFERSE